jgi:Ca2+-binding EF-hand superfamily protein
MRLIVRFFICIQNVCSETRSINILYFFKTFLAFVAAAVAMCYLFLLVFTWVYIGDTLVISWPAMGVEFTLLTPFKSLKFIVIMYMFVGFISFIVWIVGSVLLNLSSFCAATAPGLYNFATFLIGIYWMGFIITGLYMVKFFFGSNIAKMLKESTRASTIDEVEEKIFKAKFQAYDPEKENRIPTDKVPLMLEDLGVFVPEDELSALLQTLDEDETGFIEYKPLLHWFRKLNAELDEQGGGDSFEDDDEDKDNNMDDTDKEAAAMFANKSR